MIYLRDLAKNNVYGRKDTKKFLRCDKLISRGAVGSSSYSYGQHESANVGLYNKGEVVGVSVNGKRKIRISFDRRELRKALSAGCLIISDDKHDRMRDFNIGERELERFLIDNGYIELKDRGIWFKKKAS